jgi:MFS family permease
MSLKSGLVLGSLLLLTTIGSPLEGLPLILIQFHLKTEFLLSTTESSKFMFALSVPVYFSVIIALVRDFSKNPSKMDDLYLSLGSAGGVLSFIICALLQNNYVVFFIFCILSSVSFVFITVAAQGIMVMQAKLHSASNNVSVLWNVTERLPSLISYLLGGWLVYLFSPTVLFVLFSLISICIFICNTFVRSILSHKEFCGLYQIRTASSFRFRYVLRDFGRPKVIYSYLLIISFTFSPGWQTPLFYTLLDHVGLNLTQYGSVMSIMSLGVVLGAIAFFFIPKSAHFQNSFRFIAIPLSIQSFFPLLIHDYITAVGLMMISGILYGFAITGFWSLILQNCPVGYDASACAAAVGLAVLSVRSGDLLGSWLFDNFGLLLCLLATASTTSFLFPLLRNLMKTKSPL